MSNILLFCVTFFLVLGFVRASFNQEVNEPRIFVLNRGNFTVKCSNWGATIVSVQVPDKNGKMDDIVLGYDSVQEYMTDTTYFGSIVGRVSNRIGGAQFTLDGQQYKLSANDGKNTLNGGFKGFSDFLWKVHKYHNRGRTPRVAFTYMSKDGEEGFPGDLQVSVAYTLVNSHRSSHLTINMRAKPLNKATPVSLALNTYWNLGGHDSGSIMPHKVKILGPYITPVDDQLVPTGKIDPVQGTPYDFRESAVIASKANNMNPPSGYDTFYVLDESNKSRRAAIVYDEKSGRAMEVFTNQPGLQFSTGGWIKGVKGKGGFVYQENAGLCLSSQSFPDAVNHPNFPSQIVELGKTYKHHMSYKFYVGCN